MDNVVERGQYAESNAKDFKIYLLVKNKFSRKSWTSDKGLGDPLTQFYYSWTNIATQTGGGLFQIY